MRELSFLIELLVNHKLGKATKDLIVARIKEVEEIGTAVGVGPIARGLIPASIAGQAPSTQAILARNPDLIPGSPTEAPVIPVEIIAQTPATAAAMQSRQQAIAMRAKGGLEPGASSPRKW